MSLRDLAHLHKSHLYNFSTLLIVQAIITGAGFVTRVKIANELGKESFGLMAYGLALGNLGAVLVRFGMDKTLVRDLSHDRDRFNETAVASIVLRGGLLLFLIFIVMVWQSVISGTHRLGIGVLMIMLATALMSIDLQGVYDSWREIRRHSLYTLFQKMLYFALVWTPIVFLPSLLSLEWIGYSMLGTMLLYLLIQYRWAHLRVNMFSNAQLSFIKVKRLASKNGLICVSAVLALAFGTINQIFLKTYCGSAELGGYAAAWQIVSLTMVVLFQISRIGKPEMAEATLPGAPFQLRLMFSLKYAAIMFGVAACIGIPAIVFPDVIMRILFRPEYRSAAAALSLMGVYLLVFSVGIVASEYIIARKMERLYLSSVVFGAAVSLLLCFTLIPDLKSYGAALALLIGHGVSMICYMAGAVYDIRKG